MIDYVLKFDPDNFKLQYKKALYHYRRKEYEEGKLILVKLKERKPKQKDV